MSKTLSGKYYQESKQKLKMKDQQSCQNFPEEEKEKK